MNSTYSLSDLRDIALPEPPPLWPPAPGALLLMGFLLLLVLGGAYLFYNRWKRNEYRRAGLSLLEDAVTLHDVAVILKRVALAAFGREKVASLHGDEWLAFLHTSCYRSRIPQSLVTASEQLVTRKDLNIAAHWIRHHTRKDDGEVE